MTSAPATPAAPDPWSLLLRTATRLSDALAQERAQAGVTAADQYARLRGELLLTCTIPVRPWTARVQALPPMYTTPDHWSALVSCLAATVVTEALGRAVPGLRQSAT